MKLFMWVGKTVTSLFNDNARLDLSIRRESKIGREHETELHRAFGVPQTCQMKIWCKEQALGSGSPGILEK
jgi:hypothetical protein